MHTVTLEGKGDLTEWRNAARRMLLAGVLPSAIDWRTRDTVDGDLFAPAEDGQSCLEKEPLPNPSPQGGGANPASLSMAPDIFAQRTLQGQTEDAASKPLPLVGRGWGGVLASSPTAPATPVSADAPSPKTLTVPKAFLPLAEAAICHSDPMRFPLLYRVLFRLQEERALLDVRSDIDVAQLHAMEKSVRRDSHKMKAFVRFKEIAPEPGSPRRRFFAWFEPDHHIVARAAPFFQRRFTDMDWIIATPKGAAAWDGVALKTSTLPADNPMLSDETDTLWRTYFANIFNPARLKVKAMQAEMPKKYWKNLPEAGLIPGMIASAEASVVAMAEQAAREAPLFHARLQAAARDVPAPVSPTAGTLEELRAQALTCTRCALHCRATQTVFGEGPADARIMIVGEQPGDQEDLAGRPFIGPAGQVFDTVAADMGFDRARAYVTNAVKHFKYEPRGKRRIHQKPNMGEVQHCKWWLQREIDLIRPALVVALGSTALAALTDSRQRLADLRGRTVPLAPNLSLLTTVHPAYLLRIPDEGKRREEMERFREDIGAIAAFEKGGAR